MSASFGLIGEKLSHSISPLIHEEILKYISLDGTYQLFEIKKENLKNEFIKIISDGISGLNVTIPYKVEIMKYISDLSMEARAIGAVNTLKIVNNNIIGYNTDYFGIDITFKKHKVKLTNSSAVILGNGGAAAAVLQYLKDNNCNDITIVVRDIEKVQKEARFSGCTFINYTMLNMITQKDILINCTPCGMYPNINISPVDEKFIEGFSFVFDLIYNPLETTLLKGSKKYNIQSSNGLFMLVGQAVAAQSIWNDFDYELDMVEHIYKKVLEKVNLNG